LQPGTSGSSLNTKENKFHRQDHSFILFSPFFSLQFGFQEPGTNEEIEAFAKAKGFTGILMDKINVNGKNSSPVFDYLKVGANDTSLIGWNFAKFLVKKDGTVAGRW
jgi:glutathione peroxidase-family protein